MKIFIICDCGAKELLKSEDVPYRSINFYSEKFSIEGYDDGSAYIVCKECDKKLDF